MSMFKDFIEWRSFFLGIVEWWRAEVLPHVKAFVEWASSLLGLTLPDISDGLVLYTLLSIGVLRVIADEVRGLPLRFVTEPLLLLGGIGTTIVIFCTLPLILVMMPATIVFPDLRDQNVSDTRNVRGVYLMLSPLIYFAVAVAANYALFSQAA